MLLLRHARSDWTVSDPNDHDRPLAKQGRRAAGGLAGRVAGDERPELILCSSARRAVETLAGVSSLIGPRTEVHVEHALYGAGEAELLARLRRIPVPLRSVLVIGHNPSLHDLALRVTGEGEPRALEALSERLVAGGLAALALDRPWSGLGTGTARLLRYVVPDDPS